MKRTLLSLSLLLGGFSFAQDCSEIFISEYLEGKGNNKALEIYNPTSSAVDLSEYMVIRYNNGADSADASNAVQLSGTLAPNSVHVGVLDKRDATAVGSQFDNPIDSALMDLADAFYTPQYNTSNAFYWNGNDAIALAKGSVNDITNAQLVDVFGKIGEDPDPSWTTEGPNYIASDGGTYITKDFMLQRKYGVLKGVTNPVITVFNALAEYDSISAPRYVSLADGNDPYATQPYTLISGSYNSLGYHSCGCGTTDVKEITAMEISIFPNPSNGNFAVKGEVASVNVINALGQKVVADVNTTGTITTVNIDRKKGVYFVRVVGINGQEITERVIIK